MNKRRGSLTGLGSRTCDLPSGTFLASRMGVQRTLSPSLRLFCGCRALSPLPIGDLTSSDRESAPCSLPLRRRAGHESETSGKGWRALPPPGMVWDSGVQAGLGEVMGARRKPGAGGQTLAPSWQTARSLTLLTTCRIFTVNFTQPLGRVLGTWTGLIFTKQQLLRDPDKPGQD